MQGKIIKHSLDKGEQGKAGGYSLDYEKQKKASIQGLDMEDQVKVGGHGLDKRGAEEDRWFWAGQWGEGKAGIQELYK